jgi:ubiquinone/menaquinone biosynthesis C-methylase UbiE
MPGNSDQVRLRAEFYRRDHSADVKELYSFSNESHLFMIQQRQRAILKCLRSNGFHSLTGKRILDVGCGNGSMFFEFLRLDLLPGNLHGVDLLLDRLESAHQVFPNLPLTNADGQDLPYASNSFDMTMQFTVFSSILDNAVRVNLAREMVRVLKPGGLLLWYDFWINPTNHQTRGIRLAEICRLFPGCTYEVYKITLAPPITRRIVPIFWGLALFLESLKIFNTHYLVVIKPG